MAVTTQLLGSFPILRTLSESVLAQLASQSILHKFARRGMVLHAGKKVESVCFLFEGRLQGVDFTLDGREVGLYFVEPGDFCGELALFDQGEQPEHVLALTRSMVVSVPIPALRQVMFDSRQMLDALCTRMAGKVRLMAAQRGLLGIPNIAQRVCGQLWMLIPEKERQLETANIPFPPTHQEIAIMLNLSRETVTRVFQTLQSNNIVKRDGAAQLQITDPVALHKLALGDITL